LGNRANELKEKNAILPPEKAQYMISYLMDTDYSGEGIITVSPSYLFPFSPNFPALFQHRTYLCFRGFRRRVENRSHVIPTSEIIQVN